MGRHECDGLGHNSGYGSLSTFTLQGWQECIQEARELKVLNLSGRPVASRIFPLPPTSLEHLILERCLLDFSSINVLPKLMSLNIKHCKVVIDLPSALVEMNALKEILIDGTDVEEINLPDNLMKRLKVLSACHCKKLRRIPNFLNSCCMQGLSFEGCAVILDLPNSMEKLQNLNQLDLSETMITQLNPSFGKLEKLEILRMRRSYLDEFPKAIEKTKVSRLHMNRTNYSNLEILEHADVLNVHILSDP
ncbi:hypothetical protein MLD38_014570 [Melastoma candidum]|uniref:Uncharacterized protein n=1 Tax=Melastoma candidum TaxID=119954 RepID=A0ACB9RD45_9MYRT|nr:hypothetical protein MLD38_014570 [Melastoma candidum]